MVNKTAYELGANRSCIRDLFEYGRQRAAIVGEENVYDYSLGNPSIPCPPEVDDAIRDILKDTDSLLVHGYTSAVGDYATRKAIADDLNERYDAGAAPEDFFIGSGAAPELVAVLRALAIPGGDVVAIAPYFPEYKPFAENAGLVFKVVPPDVPDFQINFEALDKAITYKTQAVILNSPNNPSGVVYTRETLKKLSYLIQDKVMEFGHPVYLISDEPYRELAYGVEVPFLPTIHADTIVCYSYSKSLSLPGDRIGYVAVNPASGVSKMLAIMCGQISRGIGHNCPTALMQLAAARCCDMTADLSVYETNMNILYDGLTALGFEIVRPGGTFYMFPKALEEDAVAFSKKAMQHDLILVPGDSFGAPGYFRIAYCVDTEKVERSLDAFRRFVKAEY